MYKSQFGGTDDVDVTRKNAKRFIDPDRAIQNGCLAGFYCPDASTMEVRWICLMTACAVDADRLPTQQLYRRVPPTTGALNEPSSL